jgi:Xaa-Pro aminopeptidase
VHFGPLPDDLRHRVLATAQVNAVLIANSRPGSCLADILAQGKQAYANVGFPDEWRQHHQGGITGYEPREQLATPVSTEMIAEGQALAWNPSIAGAKMEDTILVGSRSNEILTSTPPWPIETFSFPNQPGEVICHLALEV